jgi:hypothetical protein
MPEIAIRFTAAIVMQIGRPFSLRECPFASVLVRINIRGRAANENS